MTDKKRELSALFYPNVPFETLFIPYIYQEIYFDGLYVDVVNGQKEMTIIDVGANIGVTVNYFRNYAKKVYAIEPSSEHFAALKKNKEFNEWDNVELFNMAMADKDGEVTLSKYDKNRTCNSIINDYGENGEHEKVKAMAMDTFFKENNIEKCDFMKFDVEGAEDMILRSEGFKAVAPKIAAIEVEFHYATWPDLVKYMQSLGYTARRFECSAIVILFVR